VEKKMIFITKTRNSETTKKNLKQFRVFLFRVFVIAFIFYHGVRDTNKVLKPDAQTH